MNPPDNMPPASPSFLTTAWTVVRQAGAGSDASGAAWDQLCRGYWYPVYSYARRNGLTAVDAEDATQEFFAWMLESDVILRADAERGRFRSFLIAAFKQFLSRRRIYDGAAKRKPPQPVLSLSREVGELRLASESALDRTPELQFDRDWALAVIERAFQRLESEWQSPGKIERYRELRPHLLPTSEFSLTEIASRLQLSEGAVRVALYRLKQRYGELLRDEISQTLSRLEELEDELRHLLTVLAG